VTTGIESMKRVYGGKSTGQSTASATSHISNFIITSSSDA